MSKLTEDPRIDPRIKALMGAFPTIPQPDAESREQMLDDLRRGIRKLAKRQRTWFRGMERRGMEATWIETDGADAMLAWAKDSR